MQTTCRAKLPVKPSPWYQFHVVLVRETKKVEPLAYPWQQVPVFVSGRRRCWILGVRSRAALLMCSFALPACLACFSMLLPVTRESCRDLNAAPLVAVASLAVTYQVGLK